MVRAHIWVLEHVSHQWPIIKESPLEKVPNELVSSNNRILSVFTLKQDIQACGLHSQFECRTLKLWLVFFLTANQRTALTHPIVYCIHVCVNTQVNLCTSQIFAISHKINAENNSGHSGHTITLYLQRAAYYCIADIRYGIFEAITFMLLPSCEK